MTRIDHLGIAVNSIEAARGFYEALGLTVTHEETVEHEQVHTAMIPMFDSRIELLEPTSVDSPVGRFLKKRGRVCIMLPCMWTILPILCGLSGLGASE